MQPNDPPEPARERPDPVEPAEFPDDVARTEHDAVSTSFDPGTGERLKAAVKVIAIVLLVGFVAVRVVRFFHDRGIARAGEVAVAAPPLVDVVVARAATSDQPLVLPGQTAAWFESTVYARVNGYVARWSADIGDAVKRGQVLATIDTPELDAELGEARAELQAAEAQLVARQAESAFSKTTNERWRDSPKGVVSDQERESKRSDYEASVAKLRAAEAQVALDRARVDRFGALARFKQVTAPFDGTVTERRIDVGNLVTAGSGSTTTPLYRISQGNPLRVFVDVPQSLASDLMTPGVPAEVRAKDAQGAPIVGATARAARAINPQARTMRVEVDLADADRALVPGMYVLVTFKLKPHGLIEVPAAALVFRADGPQVARVGAGDRIEFSSVAIARDNGSLVELASGVTAGDRLVLNVSSQVMRGQRVRVAADAPAPASGGR